MGAAEGQMVRADLVREIVARRERGESTRQIARELAVDRKTVRRWLRIGLGSKAGLVAPIEEFTGGAVIGFARVRIADVRDEEFDEAPAGLPAARGDQRRHDSIGCVQEYGRRVVEIRLHGGHYASNLMNDKDVFIH
jgi:hypothetical protein